MSHRTCVIKLKPRFAAPPWLDDRLPRLLLGDARLCSAAAGRLFAWGEQDRNVAPPSTNRARGGRQAKKRGLAYRRPCPIFPMYDRWYGPLKSNRWKLRTFPFLPPTPARKCMEPVLYWTKRAELGLKWQKIEQPIFWDQVQPFWCTQTWEIVCWRCSQKLKTVLETLNHF
jgi:hypothetical protein